MVILRRVRTLVIRSSLRFFHATVAFEIGFQTNSSKLLSSKAQHQYGGITKNTKIARKKEEKRERTQGTKKIKIEVHKEMHKTKGSLKFGIKAGRPY